MSQSPGYEPTSERVTEDAYQAREGDYLIYLFHIATYDFAKTFTSGRRVLDFGCGTGYGAHRIASECADIVGVDISDSAIAFAREKYRADNLDFRQIKSVEDAPLPFPDGSFDVVLSFQVIEHVPDADRYLSEVRRVLAADGMLIVATPDRSTRLLPGQRPWNRYHLIEYRPADFADVMSRHFDGVEMLGMGGDEVVIGREIARSRRLKFLTLPFTFPGAPERWRQWGLGLLKTLQAKVRGADTSQQTEQQPEGAAGGAGHVLSSAAVHAYDESAIRIAAGVSPSVNIVAVGRKLDTTVA